MLCPARHTIKRGGVNMLFKKIFGRMGRMSDAAWYIFRRSAELCLVLLSCGLLLTIGAHEQVKTAEAIYETVEAVWLIGILGSVLVEDQQSRA